MQLIDQWFFTNAEEHGNEFPRQNPRDYIASYNSICRFLDPFHREVERLAMVVDRGGYLTVHGPEHIQTVIERASDLIFGLELDSTPRLGLNPYHLYLLLVAIQLHDVGNALGREHHERKIGEIIELGEAVFGNNPIETRIIQKIALAHGGYVGNDRRNKDTISAICLQKYESIVNRHVPIQLLAAILRLADELADDYTRASTIGERLGIIPEGSKVYHKYASCLKSVSVNAGDRCIELYFFMHVDDALEKLGKQTSQGLVHQFLIDEIYERTWKMYRECQYCMKFMRLTQPSMRVLEAVKVTIEIVKGNASVYTAYDPNPIPPIHYTIEDGGYPRPGGNHLSEIAKLDYLDGQSFKDAIERGDFGPPPTSEDVSAIEATVAPQSSYSFKLEDSI